MGKLKIYDADTQTGVECNKIVLCDANGNANYLNEIWFGDTKVWEYQPVSINLDIDGLVYSYSAEGPCYLRWSGDEGALQRKMRNTTTWETLKSRTLQDYYYVSSRTSLSDSTLRAKETVNLSVTHTICTFNVSVTNNASNILTLGSFPSTVTGSKGIQLSGTLSYPYVYGNSSTDWVDETRYTKYVSNHDFSYSPSIYTNGATAGYTINSNQFRQARSSEIYHHAPILYSVSSPAKTGSPQYGYAVVHGGKGMWYKWFKIANGTGHPISIVYTYSGTTYTKTLSAGASSPEEWWIDEGSTITVLITDVSPQATGSLVYHSSDYNESAGVTKSIGVGNRRYYSSVTICSFAPCQVRLGWYNRGSSGTTDTWVDQGGTSYYYPYYKTVEFYTDYASDTAPSGINCTVLTSDAAAHPFTHSDLPDSPYFSGTKYFWAIEEGSSSKSF